MYIRVLLVAVSPERRDRDEFDVYRFLIYYVYFVSFFFWFTGPDRTDRVTYVFGVLDTYARRHGAEKKYSGTPVSVPQGIRITFFNLITHIYIYIMYERVIVNQTFYTFSIILL